MQRLTSVRARNVKAWLEHAKLAVAEAREHAVKMARYAALLPSTMRPMRAPTVHQKRRLAELQKKSGRAIKVTFPSTRQPLADDCNPTHMAPAGFESEQNEGTAM